MNIYVVRHAQAEHNVLYISNDASSAVASLTPQGIKQAQTLSEKIKYITFNAIYASEMKRTVQTARILQPNQEIIQDTRINDIKTGMKGRPFSEFRKALADSDDPWNARFNDGESFEDEKARTISFLNDLKKEDFTNVLIVTHGGVANIIYGLSHNLSNKDTFNRVIDNASIFRVSLNG